MFLNLTDINGVEPEVDDAIVYFTPFQGAYRIGVGVIEAIDPREIIVNTGARKRQRVRTGLYLIPKFQPTANDKLIGVDAFGTPICVGDVVVSSNLFDVYDTQYFRNRTKIVFFATALSPFNDYRCHAEMFRAVAVKQATDTYKYNLPEGNRLMRVEYPSDDIYDSHNDFRRRDSSEPEKKPGEYRIGVRKVRVSYANCMVIKQANIRNYLLKKRLTA